MKKRPVDWEEIQVRYLHYGQTVHQILKVYDVSPHDLRQKIISEGWNILRKKLYPKPQKLSLAFLQKKILLLAHHVIEDYLNRLLPAEEMPLLRAIVKLLWPNEQTATVHKTPDFIQLPPDVDPKTV